MAQVQIVCRFVLIGSLKRDLNGPQRLRSSLDESTVVSQQCSPSLPLGVEKARTDDVYLLCAIMRIAHRQTCSTSRD